MYAYFEPIYISGSYMKLDTLLFTDDEGESSDHLDEFTEQKNRY